jgi:hypothetical protein
MPQDIQNFSDLSAINTADQLQVNLVLRQHGNIKYRIRINDITVDADSVELLFDLLDTITLKVSVTDFEPGASGLEIVNFSINGLEVLPLYKHQFSQDAYFDTIGDFEFTIPGPFYASYFNLSGQGFIA